MTNEKETTSEKEVVSTTEIVPSRQAVVKQTADIDGFLAKRQEFIKKVNAICVEGKDYHVIQGKKSLAKGGAEKIASIFQWNAIFEKDADALEMLGQIAGLVAFKCTLSKGSKFVGEGRGAASLTKNNNDPNKTLKMAQKSAFIDAVLRASGLSDFYTQDLEDMNGNDITPITPKSVPTAQKTSEVGVPATEKQINLIMDLAKQKGRIIKPEEANRIGMLNSKQASIMIDKLLKAKSLIKVSSGDTSNLRKEAKKTFQPNNEITVEDIAEADAASEKAREENPF